MPEFRVHPSVFSTSLILSLYGANIYRAPVIKQALGLAHAVPMQRKYLDLPSDKTTLTCVYPTSRSLTRGGTYPSKPGEKSLWLQGHQRPPAPLCHYHSISAPDGCHVKFFKKFMGNVHHGEKKKRQKSICLGFKILFFFFCMKRSRSAHSATCCIAISAITKTPDERAVDW